MVRAKFSNNHKIRKEKNRKYYQKIKKEFLKNITKGDI